jgi:murein peptide amidase A
MPTAFDYNDTINRLIHAAGQHGFSVSTYGKVDAEDLWVIERRAALPDAPEFYVSAGIHGDEPAGCLGLLQLMESGALPDTVHWTLFPALNPWGLSNGVRENETGCDLNRDYLTQTCYEVRAHVEWLRKKTEKTRFDLYMSLHEDWETSGFYLYEIMTQTKPRLALQILSAVEQVIPLDPGPVVDDHLLDAPGYIHHRCEPDLPFGWPEAIYHCRLHTIYSYTFETPSALDLQTRVQAHVTAVQATLQEFFRVKQD